MHLAIDSSTSRPLVAILEREQVIYEWEGPSGTFHGEYLLAGVEEGIQKNSLSLSKAAFISIGIGPGTFTGLRVGIITAKFLADIYNIPLIPVSSLLAQARNALAITDLPSDANIWSLHDAKRHEVYALSCKKNRIETITSILPSEQIAISPERLSEQIQEGDLLLGEGAENYKEYWPSQIKIAPNEEVFLKAKNIGMIAWKIFSHKNFDKNIYRAENIQAQYIQMEKF